jgi:hypothetical protein
VKSWTVLRANRLLKASARLRSKGSSRPVWAKRSNAASSRGSERKMRMAAARVSSNRSTSTKACNRSIKKSPTFSAVTSPGHTRLPSRNRASSIAKIVPDLPVYGCPSVARSATYGYGNSRSRRLRNADGRPPASRFGQEGTAAVMPDFDIARYVRSCTNILLKTRHDVRSERRGETREPWTKFLLPDTHHCAFEKARFSSYCY